jgi:fermentation-respiration switch protein FrsA (DUF1100 family)
LGEAVVITRPVSAALTAVICVTLAYLVATYLRRTAMFFPERYPEGMWEKDRYTITPEDVTIVSRDGTKLHGWMFRSPKPGAPLMVFFHGNAGNLTERAAVSEELAKRGVSVLVFDWRGYGKSEGTPNEQRIYDDALAAYDFAAKINPNIVAYGESLGGPYCAWVTKHRRVRCAIIDSSFPSLLAFANVHYFPLGYFAPLSMRTADWLNDAGVPVLLLHGKRDDVSPFDLGMKLYAQLRVPKELLTCDQAAHCEMESLEPEKYYGTVIRFIAAHVPH